MKKTCSKTKAAKQQVLTITVSASLCLCAGVRSFLMTEAALLNFPCARYAAVTPPTVPPKQLVNRSTEGAASSSNKYQFLKESKGPCSAEYESEKEKVRNIHQVHSHLEKKKKRILELRWM